MRLFSKIFFDKNPKYRNKIKLFMKEIILLLRGFESDLLRLDFVYNPIEYSQPFAHQNIASKLARVTRASNKYS
jgi:hypothetical protein